ncbi:sigma-54-dependent Fis family transcriptional regulator [Eggerthella sp. YY7918]|uniref:sigma-54 interaction domain-containing protein n=1 Tax=Eggerthella sp. (strain YY7918) TaxID=502558 RepID=UPI0002170F38|nr:sigma 54-interacting transcriptional regulator [Eggerthella sp. YY7918]BAK43876.1 transcriptional regulator containing PAS [Eggerthella sp. YY7918]
MDIARYDDATIRSLKERVLAGDTSAKNGSYAHLCDEWIRSAALSVDRHMKSIDESTRNLNIFDDLDRQHFTHLAYLKEYYETRKDFLGSQGAALFYLNEELTVFSKGGDRTLLDELKARGLRLGTVLSEDNVGITAASLARKTPFETFVRIGQENYLDILCDYACYARFGVQESSNFATINVALVPLERLTDQMHKTLCYALSVEDFVFKNRLLYPVIEQRIGLLEKSAHTSPDAFILVNNHGEVVFADRLFQQEFGHAPSSSDGVPLVSFMPELEPYLANLKGRAHVPPEIFVTNKRGESHFYPVNCQHIREDDGSIAGLKITIASQQSGRNEPSKSAMFTFNDLKGNAAAFRSAKETAACAAASPSNVLITGESGTGKEMFAQAIHNASARRKSPFIPINCGAVPKELIGSELFGYEDGAFTGARKGGAPGKFEQANGGTVFLDEIAEMPLDMQSFLLRFLEDGVVSRIGSKKFLKLDVRIIAATNKDLWECVHQNTFRLDLYFRLNVLHLELPSLRDRPGDMEMLVEHFLTNLSVRLDKNITTAAPEVIELFSRYTWPGNLRELRNILERCVNVSTTSELTIDSMPPDVVEMLLGAGSQPTQSASPTREMLPPEHALSPELTYEKYEADRIRQLLIEHRGNKSLVARDMGMSRSTLYRKLERMKG